jgi:hypothetical protein
MTGVATVSAGKILATGDDCGDGERENKQEGPTHGVPLQIAQK